jgi:hypothetical protein
LKFFYSAEVIIFLKRIIQYTCQRLLGVDRFLLLTALFQWYIIRIFRPDRELRFFIDQMPTQGIIVDAGANLGITSLIMARLRPECQIIAFEPVPANLRCLKKMVKWLVEKRVQMHGLSRVVETPESEYLVFDVSAQCLNDIPELQPPARWIGIKIDVENFEWYVLQGGVEVISAARPIIFCEIWDTIRRDLTLQLLGQLNYSPYLLNQNKLELFTGQPALNFFLIPEKLH